MVESKYIALQMIPHTLFIEWDFWILFMALFTSRFTVSNTVHICELFMYTVLFTYTVLFIRPVFFL